MEQRSNCPHCSDTKQRFYERDTGSGTVQYCHNCGYKNFIPTKNRTFKQTVDYIAKYVNSKNEETNIVKEIKLPFDFTTQIDTKAKLWLKKYGINDDEIKTFNFGWSESMQRLILPVFDSSGLIYYQARTFKPITKDNPKYINIRQQGAKNVFFRREVPNDDSKLDSVCIVEDILSAIKVGRVVRSLALLGSYFPDALNPLYRRASKILIWLDDDKYVTAVKQARKINTLFNVPVKVIRTPLDPKEYSTDEITGYLGI